MTLKHDKQLLLNFSHWLDNRYVCYNNMTHDDGDAVALGNEGHLRLVEGFLDDGGTITFGEEDEDPGDAAVACLVGLLGSKESDSIRLQAAQFLADKYLDVRFSDPEPSDDDNVEPDEDDMSPLGHVEQVINDIEVRLRVLRSLV